MHELLSLEQRVRRARRRLGEIAVWRVREAAVIGAWSFDGVTIATGDRWPNDRGVHSFKGGPFAVPADWPLDAARLSLDVGGESLLTIAYDGAAPLTLGLDLNHNEFPLDGRKGHLTIEAVAKSPFGQAVPDPRFRRAELRLIEIELDHFTAALGPVIGLAAALGEHELSPLLLELAEDAMARVRMPTRTIDVVGRVSPFAQGYGGRDEEPRHFPIVPLDDEARASIVPARAFLTSGLKGLKERFPPHGAVAYVGHAHIDTAWLWPIEETRRKVRRTFATAVDLLKRNPGFRFAQSFAEYYRYLEDDDPALLELVREQVADGGWAPTGGLWVEPDINMPCGESLVRQALYGQLHFERTFGRRHTNAWLPDTFGFSAGPAADPQGRGPDKPLHHQDRLVGNQPLPPHPLLVGRHRRLAGAGPACSTGRRTPTTAWSTRPRCSAPGATTPTSAGRARFCSRSATATAAAGPTAEMIASQRILADFPLLPTTRFASPEAYFERAQAEAAGAPLPIWAGELYLEYHRGVLTSQGRTKRLHRQAERGLVAAEALAGFNALLGGPQPTSLAEHWRLLMINQFHDILPGSQHHRRLRPHRTRTRRGRQYGRAGGGSRPQRDREPPGRRRGRRSPGLAHRQSGPE